MSGFDPGWLSLREPADALARDTGLARQLGQWRSGPWRIVDLGCGTGANGRWLAPRLDGAQVWQLVDGDARLLRLATRGGVHIAGQRFAATFSPHWQDLRGSLRRTIAGADLVTASALLDLVSEDWLAGLVTACRDAKAACLFALSYDGTMAWAPDDPFDATVTELFNAHQRRDKGFGPALGPAAGKRAAALLRQAGYRVSVASTPWRLRESEQALQRALLAGIAAATREQAPTEAAQIDGWAERRRAWIDAGRSKATVGHTDVLALPQGARLRP
jgi:hypothetical protein